MSFEHPFMKLKVKMKERKKYVYILCSYYHIPKFLCVFSIRKCKQNELSLHLNNFPFYTMEKLERVVIPTHEMNPHILISLVLKIK